jgi:hypothetical protein
LRHVPLTVRKTMLAHVLAQAAAGLRLNEHLIQAARFTLQFRPLTGLDQEQEPERASREAGSGGGLEKLERQREAGMAQTKRGRSQDRKRVAGGQDYEVRYESKKTGKSKGAVKGAVKRAGPSRKKVERALRKK